MRASANPPTPASQPPPPFLPEPFLSETVRVKVTGALVPVPALFLDEAVTVISLVPKALAAIRIDLPSAATSAEATPGFEEETVSL